MSPVSQLPLKMDEYKGRLRVATDVGRHPESPFIFIHLQGQLANRAQLASSRDSNELQFLRRTAEGLSIVLGERTAELQQLKIQLACEQ